MKKLLISIFTASLFISSLWAQRPDDAIIGTHNYIQLPMAPLPKEYKAFLLEANSQWDDPYRKDKIYSEFFMAGFEKKKSGETQFKVVFEEYPFKTGSAQEEIKAEKIKQDGIEKTINTYGYSFTIQYRCRVEMFDANNEMFYSNAWDENGKLSTKFYNNRDQAFSEYKKLRDNTRDQALTSCLNRASADINSKYGYPSYTYSVMLYKIKPKKFEYANHDEAFALIQSNFNIIGSNENAIEEARVKFAPAIEKWNEELKQGNPSDKKARIDADVMCATYHNLAMTNYLLKDYAAAIDFMNKSIALMPNFRGAKKYKEYYEEMKLRADANK
ncbi:MAG: hypothetical protein IPO21_03480 [Bacteroidales bacterium]|nr:hypothetical protein [Bacteroidales bacterium]